MHSNDEWRILAEKAAHEEDSKQLLETVIALNRALVEREKQEAQNLDKRSS